MNDRLNDPDQRWIRCPSGHYRDDVGPHWPQKTSTTTCPTCGAPLEVGRIVHGHWLPEGGDHAA